MNFYFVLFSPNDTPLYELESMKSDAFKGEDMGKDLPKFIIYAALDMVDELQWSFNSSSNSSSSSVQTASPYLKVVDRYNEWLVSAQLCPSGDRLMLLHDVKSEENIRQFFADAAELFTKISLNPFFEREEKVNHAAFDRRIRQSAAKYIQ